MVKARAIGAARIGRPELLAELFNAAPTGIAVGGTSGKSTVTGMIGWILHAGRPRPDGDERRGDEEFRLGADAPFASALVGGGADFVSEVDESDGSIALYEPEIAVLNNITLDHKSLDELRRLFRDFAAKAETVVLNLDDDETRLLAAALPPERLRTCSLKDHGADLFGSDIEEEPFAISFRANGVPVRLQVPGRHNVENALAALAAAEAAGVPLAEGAAALAGFKGLRRRFELVGEANGIRVIDDFGHNPDKIAATLRTLHAFPGRLLLFFQPHGYGPLKVMGEALVDMFAREMAPDDVLIMPDPVYYGGTADRSVGSDAIIAAIVARGRKAEHIADRAPMRRPPGRARPARRPHPRHGRARRHADPVRRRACREARMILLALAAAQLANPGFEQGLRGWQALGHPGIGVGVADNRGYTIRQSAEGEHYLHHRLAAAQRGAARRARCASPPASTRAAIGAG